MLAMPPVTPIAAHPLHALMLTCARSDQEFSSSLAVLPRLPPTNRAGAVCCTRGPRRALADCVPGGVGTRQGGERQYASGRLAVAFRARARRGHQNERHTAGSSGMAL
ncbi:hypothetical protein GCM10010504_71300 [Streptomyces griseus]|nr:hypothetical protein GCM10010504_71300 [Streptomyces griseus]